ncbi:MULTISPECIES: HWE histidine kinase domain-containing protein [Bradyrhizobium]|jgi:light-regulated signal transduction histidine kinase (bacteriophytochrome)/CheY-like chemotaxis protein|uniref:histidine kinase n=2 Tax=Bradyrhizobium TaxID=374 RepID=A0ABS5G9E3_9BRAD|nr:MULTISPECIES: HWE histidine kinase domain-containing protein [Bradyrhizobium]MBR1137955.1 GAF domain-containing protein [Bradyrhizobium denitrificans]MDU1493475.1 HWE histidine kinase domain-containing protein [Bradyrhizobium sp.]MDU1543770.1 HWE histidine kinase domain-containing protein [Bradyrhizobium sp.]MDU1807806.1 HWE histidine kinase domain-containing protein [Bradyrhizobium sp.]MDU3042458.1 HWE histidine kinase domain-containing protein [Bradyrhizobium sp.]
MNEQVNLTNCDREPIHVPGSVQPFGFLLALVSDFTICMASENAPDYLGGDIGGLLQKPIAAVLSPAGVAAIRSRVDYLSGPDAVERMFGIDLLGKGRLFDLAIHFSGAYLVVEAEPSLIESGANSGELVRLMLGRIRKTTSMADLAQEAARQLKLLTGFDRVMVYRFHPDGSGEVIAEVAGPGLEPFLGLHYPASDIPRQARQLYQRNWLRIIADINAAPAPLLSTPVHNAGLLDLSMSVLRAVSPIHIEYLRNMGVAASMSVSILRDGKLWGLFACHHYAPHHLSFEKRTAAELFGQMYSWLLEARERETDIAYETRAHHIQERLIERAAAQAHSKRAILDFVADYRQMIECDGIAVWSDDEITLDGETPTEAEVQDLIGFINRTSPGRICASAEIAKIYAAGEAFRARAAGFLAIPISRTPRDCLIFFRREMLRSVNWAGDPHKTYSEGPLGARLTPRKSFELWQQTVAGQAKPWTAADLRIAESLRVTLLEVILQLSELAARERRGAQERQELMIAELNHRVRNILSLVRGLVAQSKDTANSVEEFAAILGGRIQALARAHDQITNLNWAPVALRHLLESEAGAYLGARAGRVRMEGPDVALDPKAFATLALVVHEMMTNSAKYGALADSTGQVQVIWRLDPGASLVIDWKESGGPPVQPPSRRGFGTTIIERSVPFDLKGDAEIRFDLLGVQARFVIPANFVQIVPAITGAPAHHHAKQESARLSGTVLIVEDNLIIAMGAEVILLELGARHVETAASVNHALKAIERALPSFALLDINLGAESSLPVGYRLKELGVPFMFATGYGERAPLPAELSDAPIVQKPYTRELIEKALSKFK